MVVLRTRKSGGVTHESENIGSSFRTLRYKNGVPSSAAQYLAEISQSVMNRDHSNQSKSTETTLMTELPQKKKRQSSPASQSNETKDLRKRLVPLNVGGKILKGKTKKKTAEFTFEGLRQLRACGEPLVKGLSVDEIMEDLRFLRGLGV